MFNPNIFLFRKTMTNVYFKINVFYKIYLPLSYFLEFHKNSSGKILLRQNIQKSWSSENQIKYDF